MIEYYGGPTIAILGFEGESVQALKPMDPKRAKKFIKFAKETLDKLGKFNSGRELISAVRGTGKRLHIFCASPGKDTCAKKKIEDIANEHESMIVPFRGKMSMIPAKYRNPTAKSDLAQQYLKAGVMSSDKQGGTEFQNILNRMRDGSRGTKFGDPEGFVARICAIPKSDVLAYAAGTKKMDDNTYYKLASVLYQYTTPGRGVHATVRLEPVKQLYDENTPEGRRRYNPKKNVNDVPIHLVLGHELIHAWRMMEGKRIVAEGYLEEAMTVGLHPFDKLAHTENKLRFEMGYPPRAFYSHNSFASDWDAMHNLQTKNPENYNFLKKQEKDPRFLAAKLKHEKEKREAEDNQFVDLGSIFDSDD